MRLAPLLVLSTATEAQRWRLAGNLYGPAGIMIEGTLAQEFVFVTAYVSTGHQSFLGLAAAALLVPVLRLADRARFLRAHASHQAGQIGRTPEHWALRYAAGIAVTGLFWSIASCLLIGIGADPTLFMFCLMVKSVWVTGAAFRAAASPISVASVIGATLGPASILMACTGNPLLHLLGPLGIIHGCALLRSAALMGGQIRIMLQAEQNLAAANAELSRLSGTDPLTGLANRRALDEALVRHWSRAAREHTDIAALMLDVDFFKHFNDRYGHPAGDDCLRFIAARIQLCLERPHDLAGRFGGEEFLILLPATHPAGALHMAERIRASIEAGDMPHAGSVFGRVSASIGCATMRPVPGEDPSTLIVRADAALYAAKNAGRNRVAAAGDSAPAQSRHHAPVSSEWRQNSRP
jgi:diguanylate cyclase (GGDEF)-like protein